MQGSGRNDIMEIVMELTRVERTKDTNQQQKNNAGVTPAYYSRGGHDCYEFIKVMTQNLRGTEAFYIGNACKYMWRYRCRNGAEDIRKAITYLQKVVEILEEEKCSKK